MVIKAIPVTLRQLIKSHIFYNSLSVTNPKFILEGVELTLRANNWLSSVSGREDLALRANNWLSSVSGREG